MAKSAVASAPSKVVKPKANGAAKQSISNTDAGESRGDLHHRRTEAMQAARIEKRQQRDKKRAAAADRAAVARAARLDRKADERKERGE